MRSGFVGVASSSGGGPGAPGFVTNIVGTAGVTNVSLTWSAPISNGGSAITDYAIEFSSNGGTNWTVFADGTSTSTSVNVTGLTTATAYIFRVKAVNAIGNGPTTVSSSYTPAGAPFAPTSLVSTVGNTQLSIAFTAGGNNGSAITTYEYSLNGGSTWATRQTGTTASPVVITGLTNGTAYTIQLRAVNAVSFGAASASLTTNTTPYTVPDSPTISVARTASAELTITLVTAAAPNGNTVSGYKYRIKSSGAYGSYISLSGVGPWVIGSLTNGTSYTVQVVGVNAAGDGLGSNEPSAIPYTTPSAVGTVTLVDGCSTADYSWSAPSNGGSAITKYGWQSSTNGGSTWSAETETVTASASIDMYHVTSSYVVRVRAFNVAGAGSYSNASSGSTAWTYPQYSDSCTTCSCGSCDCGSNDGTKCRTYNKWVRSGCTTGPEENYGVYGACGTCSGCTTEVLQTTTGTYNGTTYYAFTDVNGANYMTVSNNGSYGCSICYEPAWYIYKCGTSTTYRIVYRGCIQYSYGGPKTTC